MSNPTKPVDILRIRGTAAKHQRDIVVKEAPVTVFLNDEAVVTLLCTPKDIEYLAVGFLSSEGVIAGKKDIKRVFGDKKDGAVWIETKSASGVTKDSHTKRYITSGCGKGVSFIDAAKYKRTLKEGSGPILSSGSVTSLMDSFQKRSETYRATGGVHSAALANDKVIVVFNEDIGRHNAIDKVLGESILKGIETGGLLLLTSGRVSSDILVKAARARIPVIVSRSAPTDLSVKLAKDMGITVVGFARGLRMNVYSNPRRISKASAVTSARLRTP